MRSAYAQSQVFAPFPTKCNATLEYANLRWLWAKSWPFAFLRLGCELKICGNKMILTCSG